MRHLLPLVLAAYCLSSLASDSSFVSGQVHGKDGATTEYRILASSPSSRQRARNPHLVYITWKYESEISIDGHPSESEQQAMQAFEQELQAGHAGQNGILSAVLSSAQQRSWIYYTDGSLEFWQGCVNAATGKRKTALDAQRSFDPTWSIYFGVVQSIKRE